MQAPVTTLAGSPADAANSASNFAVERGVAENIGRSHSLASDSKVIFSGRTMRREFRSLGKPRNEGCAIAMVGALRKRPSEARIYFAVIRALGGGANDLHRL
jgi:hypothetical protein